MYTLETTVHELMNDPALMKKFGYMLPEFFLQMVPDNLRDLPIGEVKTHLRMPWGVPYISEEIINSVNRIFDLSDREKYEFVKLWAEETPSDYYPVCDDSPESASLLKYKNSFRPGRKLALVIPGGAYNNVAISNEGMDTAEVLEKAGYAVAVLRYRCGPANAYPNPQLDAVLAVKYLRALAEESGLVNDLLVVGFSAGGHLAASAACYADEIDSLLMQQLAEKHPVLCGRYGGVRAKADRLCLAYPVINLLSETHEQTADNISGGDAALRNKLSIDLHVTGEYPKTFLWCCLDDADVPPSNAGRMYRALQEAGVESMYCTYPSGGHGIALGIGTSAEGWTDTMLHFMECSI